MSESSGINRRNLDRGVTVTVRLDRGTENVDNDVDHVVVRSLRTETTTSASVQQHVLFAIDEEHPSGEDWFPSTSTSSEIITSTGANRHVSDQRHGRSVGITERVIVDVFDGDGDSRAIARPSHEDDASSIVAEANVGIGLSGTGPRPKMSKITSGKVYHKAISVRNLKPTIPPETQIPTQQLSDAISDAIQTCYVQVITGLTDAMNPKERHRKEFRDSGRFAARFCRTRRSVCVRDGMNVNSAVEEGPIQYRLTSAAPSTDMDKSFDPSNSKWNFVCFSISKSMGIVDYVRWSYQASFAKLCLSLTIIFYAWVVLFAILIYAVGKKQPSCIFVGPDGKNFEEAGGHFIDAFAVSWTTFSTVGYGMAGPNMSNVSRCVLLNMFSAIEAFLGVLYAGFAGAVILGKIMRYNKVAGVQFSDPLCLRFGSGVQIEQRDRSKTTPGSSNVVSRSATVTKEKRNHIESDEDDDDNDNGPIPFPVLEFRIANLAFARDGGEIANAQVQVWASTWAEFANESVKDAADMFSSNGNLRRRRQQILKRQLADQQMLETQQLQKQAMSMNAAGSIMKTVGGTVSMAGKTVSESVGMAGKAVTGTVGMASKAVTGTVGMIASPRKLVGGVGMAKNKAVVLGDESRTSSSSEGAVLTDIPGDLQASFHNASSSLVPSTSLTGGNMSEDNVNGHSTAEKLNNPDEDQLQLQLSQLQAADDAFKSTVDPNVAIRLTEAMAKAVGTSTRTVTMLEDPPGNGVNQATIYSKLELENDSHPFFKRTWTLRHKVDASSPLLDARGHEILQAHLREQEVAAVGVAAEGSWPPSLNSWQALRKHIHFKEIMVTLTGTDHVTGNTVYSHALYTPVDMAIGWSFASMLRRDSNGSIRVDLGLLNDVLEQVGGGGEPLEGPQVDEDDADDCVDNFHIPDSILVGGTVDIENQQSPTAIAQNGDNGELDGDYTKEN